MYLGDKEKRKKIKQKIVTGCIGGLVGMAVLCTLFSAFSFEKKGKENGLWEKAAVWMQGQMNRTYLPVFAFLEEETGIHKSPLDLFREMMLSGTWLEGSPRQMAVEFFAPFYLLLSMSDAASGKEEKEKVAVLFTTHLECFVETYAAKMP